MNAHLQQRVKDLLAHHDSTTLATCGPAGPQISIVSMQVNGLYLTLFVPNTSDHLFNLASQTKLALLTTAWKLHGRSIVAPDESIAPPHSWQTVIRVEPVRLHVFSKDGRHCVETIDF